MESIIDKHKETKSQYESVFKKYIDKSEKQTIIDSKECGNVPFEKIEKPKSKADEYERIIDCLSINYCSVLPAIKKMQELY